jgi:hypothetical protein
VNRTRRAVAIKAGRGLALESSYSVAVAGFTLYLAARVFLLGSALARTRLQTRTILDIAFVRTGCLLLVTGPQWARFDLARVQVWYGLGAYLAFPFAATGLSWRSPPLGVLQINRCPDQVDCGHPRIAISAVLLTAVCALGLSLARGSWWQVLRD